METTETYSAERFDALTKEREQAELESRIVALIIVQMLSKDPTPNGVATAAAVNAERLSGMLTRFRLAELTVATVLEEQHAMFKPDAK